MKRISLKLSYSNVISTLCLFLLVGGGTAFAASQLEKESVGAHQLKKGAVTPVKLSAASKATLTGPKGATGATGAQGPRGERGERGERGGTGPAGPFPATLPAGQTIVGVYDVGGTAPSATKALVTGEFSYLYQAPGQTVIYVGSGTTNPTCTGSYLNPTAPAGFTCIYEQNATNVTIEHGVNSPTDQGVRLYAFSAAAGQFEIFGAWAATGK
jgi:hypothetical protein